MTIQVWRSWWQTAFRWGFFYRADGQKPPWVILRSSSKGIDWRIRHFTVKVCFVLHKMYNCIVCISTKLYYNYTTIIQQWYNFDILEMDWGCSNSVSSGDLYINLFSLRITEMGRQFEISWIQIPWDVLFVQKSSETNTLKYVWHMSFRIEENASSQEKRPTKWINKGRKAGLL